MKNAYGALKIMPIGWRPSATRTSRCVLAWRAPGASSPSGGGSFGRPEAMLVIAPRSRGSAGRDQLVDLGGRAGQRRVGALLAEDDRLGPGIAEDLPVLDRVRHVGYLDGVRGLRRELGIGRVGREVGRVQLLDPRPHRHLPGHGQQLAVLGGAGRELQEVPRGPAVLARGVHGDVLGVTEGRYLIPVAARRGRHGYHA